MKKHKLFVAQSCKVVSTIRIHGVYELTGCITKAATWSLSLSSWQEYVQWSQHHTSSTQNLCQSLMYTFAVETAIDHHSVPRTEVTQSTSQISPVRGDVTLSAPAAIIFKGFSGSVQACAWAFSLSLSFPWAVDFLTANHTRKTMPGLDPSSGLLSCFPQSIKALAFELLCGVYHQVSKEEAQHLSAPCAGFRHFGSLDVRQLKSLLETLRSICMGVLADQLTCRLAPGTGTPMVPTQKRIHRPKPPHTTDVTLRRYATFAIIDLLQDVQARRGGLPSLCRAAM
eukprot:4112327-Amphidinium_carterae.1